MNPLDLLFRQVAGQIQNHASPDTPGPSYDAGGLLNAIGGLFGQHAQQSGSQFGGYDPNQDYRQDNNYGGGGIASSDQDPYGDPGLSNQQGSNAAFGNIESSDKDPYGDPGAR